MRSMIRTAAVALLVALVGAGSVQGQASDALYTRWAGFTGFQFQSYNFSSGPVSSTSQWAIPVVVVAPLGSSASVDLTGHYAHSSSTTGGVEQTISGLTDTQLRFLYTLGRDRAIASLSFNLPTASHPAFASQGGVSAIAGSNYLSFPVADFGTAFGVTGGLTYATPAGAWNLGISGAVRYTGSYTPYSDQPQTDKPGVEFRGRLGADRLVGQSARFLVGVTASTFSNDQFTGTGSLPAGPYQPGLRIIGDLGWRQVMGSSALMLSVWDYYRASGTFQDTLTVPKENIFNAEARFSIPAGPRLSVEPLIDFRLWSPDTLSGGSFFAGGLAARYGLSDVLTASLEGRYSTGKVLQQAPPLVSFTGASVQLLLQYQH